MRIVIAGLYRSGSTWLFNVVRLICQQHGTVYSCFGDKYEAYEAMKYDFQVVKVHKFDEIWIKDSVILTSWRPWREVRKSMIRLRQQGHTGNKTQHIRLVSFIEDLARWNCHNNYMMHFEDIYTRPYGVINDVSAAIGLECNTRKIFNKVSKIKPPSKGVDNKTLLHAGHITKFYSKKDFKKYSYGTKKSNKKKDYHKDK